MTQAFGITLEDLENILHQEKIPWDPATVKKVYETAVEPHTNRIAAAALAADCGEDDEATLAAQTEAAYTEIRTILREAQLLQCPIRRKILADGKEIEAERIEIIYEGVSIPGQEGPGSLYVNATEEGIILDVWGKTPEMIETNCGTSSETVAEIVERLCSENE